LPVSRLAGYPACRLSSQFCEAAPAFAATLIFQMVDQRRDDPPVKEPAFLFSFAVAGSSETTLLFSIASPRIGPHPIINVYKVCFLS